MCSNRDTLRRQLRPKACVDSRRNQIEREDWQPQEQGLDEGLPTRPPVVAVRSVHTMEKL